MTLTTQQIQSALDRANARITREQEQSEAVHVTADEFVERFVGKGSRFAVIYSVTHPDLLKKHRITKEPCPFPEGVEHRAIRSVQFGAVYENAVNNQRLREGNEEPFVAEGLWPSKQFPEGAGERVDAFRVRHKGSGKTYFAIRPAADAHGYAKVKWGQWIDVATGEPLSDDVVENVLPHFLPVQKEDSGRQELDKPLPWRTFEVANVVAIQCGELFVLDRSVPSIGTNRIANLVTA